MKLLFAVRVQFLCALLTLAISGVARGSALESEAPAPPEGSVPGEILFQLTDTAFASNSYQSDLATEGRTGLEALDARLGIIGANEIRPVFDLSRNATIKRSMGMDRIFRITFDSNLTPEEAVAAVGSLSELEYVETNGTCHTMVSPNDTLYDDQWAHDNHGQASRFGGGTVGTDDCDTDTDTAWDLQTGDPNLVVAILDTGCDLNHPEYSSRLVQGFDFVNNDNNPTDDGNHGTACAGIALATGNNGQGIAGVAWNVKLMPIKVLDAGGSGSWTGVSNGIEFGADNGARILSLSLGGSGGNNTLQNACNYAHSMGSAMFCASGNAGSSSMLYPAAYSNTIAVGAMSPCCERKTTSSCDGENWWGSSYGQGLDFLTPGVRIHTTDRLGNAGYSSGDYTSTFNGTSSATPHAAGIGALVWSEDPTLSNEELRTVLQNSCDDLGSNGYDQQTGHGRLNAETAVLAVLSQGVGSCCYNDGSCGTTLEGDCASGNWSPDPCSPNPCPAPSRPCCIGNNCEIMTQEDCVNDGGTWKWIATSCDPDPCFVTDAPGDLSIPSVTRLMLSTPNPFREATVLRYQLAQASPVTLRVYDISGSVVRTILDGSSRVAAEHREVWDGKDDRGNPVASGMYLFYLQAAGTTDSQTVILTR